MTRQDKIDKLDAEVKRAYTEYHEAVLHATDDPEPQADDEETIREVLERIRRRSYEVGENGRFIMEFELSDDDALAALSRLSASASSPIDVQAKAEAVVDAFDDTEYALVPEHKGKLIRLIVEQFSSKG
jgi:hypothetical protein